MGEGGGASATSVPRQSHTRGGGMAGGGPDPERERGLPRHIPHGGDLEDGGGDSQSPLHRRHHLPRIPPRIPESLQYMERHPRAQASSAGCSIEIGGPPCNLPGPAQGLKCLGQVQVNGYPGGLWRGAQGPSPPPTVLGEAEDCGEGGRVLWCTLLRRERRVTQGDPLSPTIFNVMVDAVIRHWESLLVAEQEGGESSGDKGDGTQTEGRTIQDQDDRRQWAEEVHKRLTVKVAFLMTTMGWLLPQTWVGSSRRSIC